MSKTEIYRVISFAEVTIISFNPCKSKASWIAGSVAKFDCIFALVQCCAILFVKKPKAGTIHDD